MTRSAEKTTTYAVLNALVGAPGGNRITWPGLETGNQKSFTIMNHTSMRYYCPVLHRERRSLFKEENAYLQCGQRAGTQPRDRTAPCT